MTCASKKSGILCQFVKFQVQIQIWFPALPLIAVEGSEPNGIPMFDL